MRRFNARYLEITMNASHRWYFNDYTFLTPEGARRLKVRGPAFKGSGGVEAEGLECQIDFSQRARRGNQSS